MQPLLIVDGDNLAHRAYHSSPKTEEATNAISGFFSILTRIIGEEEPRGVFVAWDTIGVDTYRSEMWPGYQGGRYFAPDLLTQLDRLPDLCRLFEFGVGKEAGFEADDLMASACRLEVERGGTCLILTTDRDSYQLVSPSVTVLVPKPRTRELARISPQEVVKELGVLPEQVPCYKALAGDNSDKIPGAKGIGPKSAAALLLKHGVLDVVVDSLPVEEARQCMMFREMVRMRSDVPVVLPEGPPNWISGAKGLRTLGLAGLAERIETAFPV